MIVFFLVDKLPAGRAGHLLETPGQKSETWLIVLRIQNLCTDLFIYEFIQLYVTSKLKNLQNINLDLQVSFMKIYQVIPRQYKKITRILWWIRNALADKSLWRSGRFSLTLRLWVQITLPINQNK